MAFSFGLTGLGSSLQKTLSSSELEKRASLLSSIDAAFGVPVPSEIKTVDVAQDKFDAMFEKTKATQTYGFSDSLKFRVVIPFKNLFGKASEEEKEDLELYNMHQELRSSVEVVQKAYQNYLPAEKAVTQATPENLRTARFQEKNKATALITSYKDLIALAVKQAEELSKKAGTQSGRKDYLEDAQAALNEGIEAQGAIFYTVHMLSTREAVRGSVEGSELATNFIALVNNYNHLELKAFSEFGSAELFKEAFIEGLAAVPGLKASDVATYESFLSVAKEQYYEEMFNHFVAEMDIIIQGNKSAKEVLPGIQYNGVYFPLTDELIERLDQARTRLQQLKELEAQRDALGLQDKEAEEAIESLKTATQYTVQEFADFVGTTNDKAGLLRKIEAGKDRFAAVRALETIQKQIAKFEEQSAKDIAEFEEKIGGKARELDELQRAFEAKAAEEQVCEKEIRTLTTSLQTLQQGVAHVNNEISSLSFTSSSTQEIYEQMKIAGRDALAVREKTYIDTIEKLRGELKTHRQDLEQRGGALGKLKLEIDFDKAHAAEFKKTGSPDVKDELLRLRTAQETLSQASSEIAGDELLEIANSLGMSSKREGNLGAALANAQKVLELEEARAIRNKEFEQVELSILKAKQDLPQGITYIGETLKVVPEEIFSAEQVIQMNERLDEKLNVAIEISKKVHDDVLKTRETLLDQADGKKYLGLTGLEQEALLTKRQEERVLGRRDSFSSEASSESSAESLSTTAVSQPGFISRTFGPARPAAADYFGKNALGMPIAPAAQPVATEVFNIDEV